jgi:hypothetical protein
MISEKVWVFLGTRECLPQSLEFMAYHKNQSFLVSVDGECHVGDIIEFTTDGLPWNRMNKRGHIIDNGMFKISKG